MDDDQLLSELQELYRRGEAEMRRDFNRSLPFADVVLRNRWERAKALGFGAGASIYDSAIVFGNVTVGEQTWIGPSVLLDGSGGPLTIGAWCSISAGVHIYTHDTVLRSLSGGAIDRHCAGVSIGDRCHIGAQSVIRAGVNIGAMCVVGANSFVNRDVPERSIVGGSACRILGRVEGDGAAVRLVIDRQARA